jgi:hypothetical protein
MAPLSRGPVLLTRIASGMRPWLIAPQRPQRQATD